MSKPHVSDRRHGHGKRSDSATTRRVLWVAFALTGAFAVVEAVGGLWAGSLALISDAGHMVTGTTRSNLLPDTPTVAEFVPS